MASNMSRADAGGSATRGSSSSLTGPPTCAYRNGAKLCATNLCTAASAAAASRMSVPLVRSSFVGAKTRSILREKAWPARAVAW